MANNNDSPEVKIIALGFTAKKQLVEAGISEKHAAALIQSEAWNAEESEAITAFTTAFTAAKEANNVEITTKLADALESVKLARDIAVSSDDGVLNDLQALEAKITQNFQDWQLEAIAVQTRLEAKRTQIKDNFGDSNQLEQSFAEANSTALLNDGSSRLLITMPTEYTLGNLQDELDPSFNGAAVSGDTFGWLPLPAGVETLEAAKEHYGIEGDTNQIILEQNFDYMKDAITSAENEEFDSENFSFGPYNELGLPTPDASPQVLASWYWKLKADQKFKVGTIVGIADSMETIYGNITMDNKIFTKGTAAVAGDDWKIHTGVDFSSTQNPFHLLPTDMDYVNASLIYGNTGVRKIFFNESAPGAPDMSKSAKMGIKIFRNWMEQKGFIASQYTDSYDSEKHDITPYGSISVLLSANEDVDEAVFNTARTHIMDVMFGWNMDKMREENNTLHTLLTHLVWSSFQLYFDYQLAEFNQTPNNNGVPVIRLRQANGTQSNVDLDKYVTQAQSYYAGETNTVISAFEELEENWDTLKDVDSFGAMGPQLMHMFDYTIYAYHLNYLYQNHFPSYLMPVRTTQQKVELDEGNFGRFILSYDLAEYDKAVAGDYKIHVPRVEGIGGMTTQQFEDFAVEDEVYCEMSNYLNRGMSPLYGYNTVTVHRVEEEGIAKIWMNSVSYTYNASKFGTRWIKSSAEGVTLQDTSSNQTMPVLHFDISEVTTEKMDAFKAMFDNGDLTCYYMGLGQNDNFDKFYLRGNDNTPDKVVEAFETAGIKFDLTWFESVGHNAVYARPLFEGVNPNNVSVSDGLGGWRNLETGEKLDESNALNYIGLNATSYSFQFPYWAGSNFANNNIWGGTMYHLASDFTPSYTPGFVWNAFAGETIYYGNFASQNGQIGNFGNMDIVKNIQYDPDIKGKILPEILPEDKYYSYNGNYWQSPSVFELDSEGNYTPIDIFSDEFLSRTHLGVDLYANSANTNPVSQTPTELTEWLGHHWANFSVTLQKIAKNSDGKVFNQMVAHPNYWIKEGDSFTMANMPSDITSGIVTKYALAGNNNPLSGILGSQVFQFFKKNPNTNIDYLDKRDTVEVTINFPDFMGVEGVSYTKPINSGLFTTGFANNGGAMWDDSMLPVFQYLHNCIRTIIGKKDPVTGNAIKADGIDVYTWRSKVLTEGANWGEYLIKSILDEPFGFTMTEELCFFDPKIKDLVKTHYNLSYNSFYYDNLYYRAVYFMQQAFTMDANYTLNSDGSIVIDVIKPFILSLNRTGEGTTEFKMPYYLEPLALNEETIGEGDSMTWTQDWDVSVYRGHAYNVANDFPSIVGDERWDGNSIFDVESAGEYAIKEPGGDGHYIRTGTLMQSYTAVGTNAILPGDIDADGDSIGNLNDNFPSDVREIFDADGDGVGNYMDQFPFSTIAQWSILEDKDGNQYAVPGNLGNRGWGANEVKILDLPDFMGEDTGLVNIDEHEVTGNIIVKYVSSQPTEPADMPKLNLNHITDVKMIHKVELSENIFEGMYHIQGELLNWYVNPDDSSQALGEYSYQNVPVLADYIEAFENGTADFAHAEAYLVAKSNVTSVTVNVRIGDGWGDGTLQNGTQVSLVAGNGEIIQSVAALLGYGNDAAGYDKWNAENMYINGDINTGTKLMDASGKEAWVCFQNVDLEPGNYTIRLTGDSYSHQEGSIAITTGPLGGAESYLVGYGKVFADPSGDIVRLVETDYTFTIS